MQGGVDSQSLNQEKNVAFDYTGAQTENTVVSMGVIKRTGKHNELNLTVQKI